MPNYNVGGIDLDKTVHGKCVSPCLNKVLPIFMLVRERSECWFWLCQELNLNEDVINNEQDYMVWLIEKDSRMQLRNYIVLATAIYNTALLNHQSWLAYLLLQGCSILALAFYTLSVEVSISPVMINSTTYQNYLLKLEFYRYSRFCTLYNLVSLLSLKPCQIVIIQKNLSYGWRKWMLLSYQWCQLYYTKFEEPISTLRWTKYLLIVINWIFKYQY